jgi:hypothetical protein
MSFNTTRIFYYLRQSFTPNTTDMPTRRYDLDWLRVLAFGLLILFHSGMFYVESWGFHAKSIYRSQSLENVMLLIQPWRMVVLWIIAGIAIKFIAAKVSTARFIYQRSVRILIPLFFGILIVVPPQLYVEMTQNGDLNLNFWQFMAAFYTPDTEVFAKYTSGIWPHIDVNHLWFLRSLWKYSLAIVLLMPLLNAPWLSLLLHKLFNQSLILVIAVLTIPLFIIELSWPEDYSRYAIGFTAMLYGYLIGWSPKFWQQVTQHRFKLLSALAVSAIILIIFYNVVWLNPDNKPAWLNVVGLLNYSAMRMLGVFTAFGFAHHYLNKPSKRLSYLNDAVYHFYILHQTFIIVIGYQLTALSLGPIVEPILLISLTTLSCFMSFEIIKRIDILRPFFGLATTKTYPRVITIMGQVVAVIAMLVIGLEILL